MRRFGRLALIAIALSAVPAFARADESSFIADGIARLNYYRAMAKLPAVTLDPVLSAGARAHARYLVENGIADGVIRYRKGVVRTAMNQDAFQWEDRRHPGYSNEGISAAGGAIVIASDNLNTSGAALVDQLISFPYGSVNALMPQWAAAGIGSYCGVGFCETVIVPGLGLAKDAFLAMYNADDNERMWRATLGTMPLQQQELKNPIVFPPDGSTVSLSRNAGGDWLPIEQSCPGYSTPTGLAIVFQLGKGQGQDGAIAVTEQSISRAGQVLDSCLLTSAKFADKKSPIATDMGRTLEFMGAAVIVPRSPLAAGHYTVSLTADSKPYRWSFTVAPPSK
jgi:hypothetical protein